MQKEFITTLTLIGCYSSIFLVVAILCTINDPHLLDCPPTFNIQPFWLKVTHIDTCDFRHYLRFNAATCQCEGTTAEGKSSTERTRGCGEDWRFPWTWSSRTGKGRELRGCTGAIWCCTSKQVPRQVAASNSFQQIPSAVRNSRHNDWHSACQ